MFKVKRRLIHRRNHRNRAGSVTDDGNHSSDSLCATHAERRPLKSCIKRERRQTAVHRENHTPSLGDPAVAEVQSYSSRDSRESLSVKSAASFSLTSIDEHSTVNLSCLTKDDSRYTGPIDLDEASQFFGEEKIEETSEQEPIKSDYQSESSANSFSEGSSPALGSRSTKKVVRFKSVHIREFERIIGDNPSCSSGAPIGIGWGHSKTDISHSLDDFENFHSGSRRRYYGSLVLTRQERERLLLHWGASLTQIVEAIRTNVRVKNQRRRTVSGVGTYDKWEELFEASGRKLKRILIPKRRKGGVYAYQQPQPQQQHFQARVLAPAHVVGISHRHSHHTHHQQHSVQLHHQEQRQQTQQHKKIASSEVNSTPDEGERERRKDREQLCADNTTSTTLHHQQQIEGGSKINEKISTAASQNDFPPTGINVGKHQSDASDIQMATAQSEFSAAKDMATPTSANAAVNTGRSHKSRHASNPVNEEDHSLMMHPNHQEDAKMNQFSSSNCIPSDVAGVQWLPGGFQLPEGFKLLKELPPDCIPRPMPLPPGAQTGGQPYYPPYQVLSAYQPHSDVCQQEEYEEYYIELPVDHQQQYAYEDDNISGFSEEDDTIDDFTQDDDDGFCGLTRDASFWELKKGPRDAPSIARVEVPITISEDGFAGGEDDHKDNDCANTGAPRQAPTLACNQLQDMVPLPLTRRHVGTNNNDVHNGIIMQALPLSPAPQQQGFILGPQTIPIGNYNGYGYFGDAVMLPTPLPSPSGQQQQGMMPPPRPLPYQSQNNSNNVIFSRDEDECDDNFGDDCDQEWERAGFSTEPPPHSNTLIQTWQD